MASVIYTGYLVINSLRYTYGEDYIFSAGYNIWSALLLPDILLAYFLFHKRQPHKYWSWFYIFLFAQTALIEKLQNHSIDTDSYYFYKHIGMFNYPALNISVLCLLVLFVYHVCKGRILSAAAFFAGTAVFMGVYFQIICLRSACFFWQLF